ncbi:MAG: hypothetical protein R3B70_01725 [Polyangiaceae bacterium]
MTTRAHRPPPVSIVLRIFDDQMEDLARARRDVFRRGMIADLREHHPRETAALSDAGLTELIDEGMRRARTHGIVTEGDVASWLHLMLDLGRDFDREIPWARDILAREDFTGRIRIDLLVAASEGRIPPPGTAFFPDPER